MKARTVYVAIEFTTDVSIKSLREKALWQDVLPNSVVEQVQVNVARNVVATAVITQNKRGKKKGRKRGSSRC